MCYSLGKEEKLYLNRLKTGIKVLWELETNNYALQSWIVKIMKKGWISEVLFGV